MKWYLCLLALLFIVFGCSGNYSDLPQLNIDFIWPENHQCSDTRSPKIILENVPADTRLIEVEMFDLDNRYDHGGGTVEFHGSTIIPESALKKYAGPCPSYGSPRYQITVKAIDGNGKVVAFGEKTKRFPPVSEG